MISIGSKTDWWNVAETIVPQLSTYANQFDVAFDAEAANIHLVNKDHKALFISLHQLWFDLPDCEEICHEPFFSLSELCSEYWLLEEGNNEW